MSLVNIFDILGCLFGIMGVVLVGNINRWGYALLLLCNIGYGGLGYIQGNWGLFAVSIFMGALDIWYFIKWSKNKKAKNKEAKCFSKNPLTRLSGQIGSYFWNKRQLKKQQLWKTNWKGERYCPLELDKQKKVCYTKVTIIKIG